MDVILLKKRTFLKKKLYIFVNSYSAS